MIAIVKRILLLMWMFCIPFNSLFSQNRSTWNNYTGVWESPATWNPSWTVPQTNISGYSITIYGFINLTGSLSFSGSTGIMTVNDTLIIEGNLSFSNNYNLTINDYGILIVRGDLTIDNETDITVNGYLIITGNVIKTGSQHHGSFRSNDNPVKVFIGGSSNVGSAESNYPVLNCPATTKIQYSNTHCTYGNMIDILSDPINSFFLNSCIAKPSITANGPITFCKGGSVTLTSTQSTTYLWSTGATTRSINITMPGSYTVRTTNSSGCQSESSLAVNVVVNDLPSVTISSSSSTMCRNEVRILTGLPAGGTFIITSGPGTVNGNVLTAIGAGIIQIEYNFSDICTNMATQAITGMENPVAVPGPDQELKYVFKTKMNAELSPPETGLWSLLSGKGKIENAFSPTTSITNLSAGENLFLWKVMNGKCRDSAEVKIKVIELLVPSVITPDGDGKNDYFRISETIGLVKLIIFNRWGNEEYKNDNYLNDWDGRNNNGSELPSDTYFYILIFEDGKISKGSVLILR